MSLWIALEGGEGCGKSTQAAHLAKRLGEAVVTREPGGTQVGAAVRALVLDPDTGVAVAPRTEALLLAADRAEHWRSVVQPALRRGWHVVSDRSAWSSLAYQGYGRGLPIDEVRHLSDWATEGVWPDLAVLLRVPRDVAAGRLHRRLDRMEDAGDDFHLRVVEGFDALAAAAAERWAVVDGTGTLDDVAARVWEAVEPRL